MFRLHWIGLGKVFASFGHVEPVEPRFLRGACTVEEQDVRGDGRVRRENAAGHPDHCVKIELGQKLSFDGCLGRFRIEQKTIRQDDGATSAGLQPVHDDGHEEVGGFAAREGRREMLLHLCFFRCRRRADS